MLSEHFFLILTTQNFYAYQYHNTKHTHVPLDTENLTPTFRILVCWDISLVGKFKVFRLAHQCNNHAVEPIYFAVATFLIWSDLTTDQCPCLYLNNERIPWCTIYKCFSLHFSTLKTIAVMQLMFPNFNYWKNPKFLHVPPADVLCLPLFEEHWFILIAYKIRNGFKWYPCIFYQFYSLKRQTWTAYRLQSCGMWYRVIW